MMYALIIKSVVLAFAAGFYAGWVVSGIWRIKQEGDADPLDRCNWD